MAESTELNPKDVESAVAIAISEVARTARTPEGVAALAELVSAYAALVRTNNDI